jgi:CRISPR-associated protein Cmr4
MYQKAYGIIETLAPLHVGASSGEENGNLNLIFRDQFTQTGIIPGSSIRGRFRADMRSIDSDRKLGYKLANIWYGHSSEADEEPTKTEADDKSKNNTKDLTTEALVKFEDASLVWLPIFCPGQPIVWVTCPRLLKRYKQITGLEEEVPQTRDANNNLLPYPARLVNNQHNRLFFNLGYLDNLQPTPGLSKWLPSTQHISPDNLVVVDDNDINIIHEMGLYRQTRTKLKDDIKNVDNFFGFEALPEESILVFPIAIKENIPQKAQEELDSLNQPHIWQQFTNNRSRSLYFGGLESIGCGRCQVTLSGEYFKKIEGN